MHFLQIADFTGRVNETFEMSLGETSMPLTLVDIRVPSPQQFPGKMRDAFSLLFQSSSPVAVPQRLYRLTNTVMGPLDIFLVAIGREPGGILYEAVFN